MRTVCLRSSITFPGNEDFLEESVEESSDTDATVERLPLLPPPSGTGSHQEELLLSDTQRLSPPPRVSPADHYSSSSLSQRSSRSNQGRNPLNFTSSRQRGESNL